jgi:hypothetical protein
MTMDRLGALILRHGFSLALGLAVAGVMLTGLIAMWRSDGPSLPGDRRELTAPPPARPERTAPPTAEDADAAKRAALETLRADAKQFDVPLEAERFLSHFPAYRSDGPWVLPGRGGLILTRELRISTELRDLTTPLGGLGTYRAPHVVLIVENRTEHHVAFRVDTTPSGSSPCTPKAMLPQSTLVLGPREALSRTECLAKGRDKLTVQRLEVMLVPPLSYHYLIKVRPGTLGIPQRIADGHSLPPGQRLCAGIPRQTIEQALRSGAASWLDVIDFYARHSCDRQEFRAGHRRPEPETSPVLQSSLLQ